MKRIRLILILLLVEILMVKAHVALIYPAGGEVFHPGDTMTITWEEIVSHDTHDWDLFYSTDGGSNWNPILLDISVDERSYKWLVPDLLNARVRIKIVQDNTGDDYDDISDNFSIVPESYVFLAADAGRDTIFCASNLDEITLGGNPAASGGTPPYEYSWSCNLKIRSHTLHASAFLKDTSIANPSFKGIHDTLTFQLQVTDDIGSTDVDSVTVIFSEFIMCLGECRLFIGEGDSVQLGHCIDGGIKPYTYSWIPTETLSDPIVGDPWAIPATTTTYDLTLTDSAGCETTTSCMVTVTPKKAYKPVLAGDTVQWNFLTDHLCGDCFYTVIYKAYGDTVIDDKHYKKLYAERRDFETYDLYGFIREDTVNGRIHMLSYAYECPDDPCLENIVYDIGLNEGDTLEFHPYLNSTEKYVVQSVVDSDNLITVSFGEAYIRFIEGVGPSREFTVEAFNSGSLSELLCKYEDNELVYSVPVFEFDTCFVPLTGTGIEKTNSVDIRAYPNPFADQLTIEGLPGDFLIIEFYDIHGRLVLRKSDNTDSSTIINTSDLNTGLYFLRVRSPGSGKIITSRKILKYIE